MSRLGKKPITVPSGVKIDIAQGAVAVEGPKGKLSMEHRPEVEVSHDEGEKVISVSVDEKYLALDRVYRAYWGTPRALINNMIEGVTNGFEKKLEIVGVGWTANLNGSTLALKVGYANIIEMPVPMGVDVKVEKQLITISGADKQAVGHFAASVRAKRKPEPYNGKGIKYAGEIIQRKSGKAFGN